MSPTFYDKPFKTYAQMIEIMRKRHIVIEDTVFAKMALENFSYYSLVNGYKNTFLQIPKTDDFIGRTRYDELNTLHIIEISLNKIQNFLPGFRNIRRINNSRRDKILKSSFPIWSSGRSPNAASRSSLFCLVSWRS